MPDFILLAATALCVAAVLTIAGARLVDGMGRSWPLPLWLLVVSLATPLAWIVLQAVALARFLSDRAAHAGFARQWPSYLEVVFAVAWKLWICGLFWAAVLAFFRRHRDDDPVANARAQRGLFLAGGAMGACILLSIKLGY